MSNNVINIREFVDVTTAIASTPTNVARDWSAVLFVQKGTDEQTTTITKYDDLAAVIAEGSNTEAAKFATKLYETKYNGVAIKAPLYVAVIGAASAAEFLTNFVPLLGSEDYYYIGLDRHFSPEMKKSAANTNEGSQTDAPHKLILDDTSTSLFNLSLEDDVAQGSTMSVAAYCASNKLNHCEVCGINPSNANKYYSASAIAFYATRKFENTILCMAPIGHKPATGIEAINFLDSNITVTPADAWHNVDEKHVNIYANVKVVGLTGWERGTTPGGENLSDYIAADYLNYTVSVAMFRLLQSVPRLAASSDGARQIASVLDAAFTKLYEAGVITGGTSIDGETFGSKGFKYTIPMPTGVAKANGLWDGIYCSALLAGSTKKVVIGNNLTK